MYNVYCSSTPNINNVIKRRANNVVDVSLESIYVQDGRKFRYPRSNYEIGTQIKVTIRIFLFNPLVNSETNSRRRR